ncbi:30S ribosomal protein S7 [Candidatus Pacearchaeota archaeon]|nr:30S ribosomal protein S7 [Candidatus Pacearchaeota archaeon]|tara:strand:- start:2045 stop:2749 length:705 start_codon:yes stop_codon:yes gene_type:complete
MAEAELEQPTEEKEESNTAEQKTRDTTDKSVEGEEGFDFKLFDIYDVSGIEIKDPAMKPYINLEPKLLLKSQGRNATEKFGKARVNILERLANRLGTSGHIGKKHKIMTSWSSGKYNKNMKTVLDALEIVKKETGANPVQVLVTAVENGSPRDEITVIEQGGARYPQAVDSSPARRVDLAIRWMVQGAYGKSFGKKKKMAVALAEEIIKASEKNGESYAVQKANEGEKQADSAR